MAKRQDYINWDEYFMGMASFTAQRSKDPVTRVGSVIVNKKNRIVSLGYNGMPRGISDDDGVWGKDLNDPLLHKKYLVVHAEVNALANTTEDVEGCTIYITHMPCNECAKILSQYGIKEIVYANDWGLKDNIDIRTISMRIIDAAGIKIRNYEGNGRFIVDVFN